MSESEYDLVVIGSGPAGQKAAIAAAKARKRVAIIDRAVMIGGVSVHTGTIPSKTIREAIFQLTGFAVKALYGSESRSRVDISVQDVASRVKAIVARETEVIRAQLKHNGIAILQGSARLLDSHALEVQGDGEGIRVEGAKILIACGTRPAHSPEIPFDNHRIVDTDHLADLGGLPKEIIVVGAGVVGLEYASFMAALGAKVTVIDQRPVVLEFVDRQIVEALSYHLRQLGVTFRLAEKVTHVGIDPVRDYVFAELESGKKVRGDALVYAVGRQANGDQIHLEAAGLVADLRGRLKVNQFFQTDVPHIYAAGDVIGFPALASTSMEQGRLAACHMFGIPFEHMPELFPYGIYTIPEISMVGQTEETLTANRVPYEVGIAKYPELAKSMMLGDETGMLKLLFDPETRKLLGVHALGQRATEIIHIGQAVLFYGGSVEYFRDMVFNYPTLAEAYKVAALDGLNKL
ncbi:MAG: Pyridine nucleotide-disulfide oxidoreductase, FAD/NAD(P)-binding domain protein [Candidatus Acidoferrum typicum]|nr:Pyridine nucleotide-disulfide oxidoreductase, FAD/NAD(P)-binding domain protein [Candidatus Acidoferrum typicum]